jgi:hypothetical protein
VVIKLVSLMVKSTAQSNGESKNIGRWIDGNIFFGSWKVK